MASLITCLAIGTLERRRALAPLLQRAEAAVGFATGLIVPAPGDKTSLLSIPGVPPALAWKEIRMSLTDGEFASILDDATKRIEGDIAWAEDEDHSPAWQFRAEVGSSAGWPLFINGYYNPQARTLSYTLILRTEGRIYGLDLGKDHHNPECIQVGDKHKHRWSEQFRDREAYVPNDITGTVANPVAVWRQFCAEARIEHKGEMRQPPLEQTDIFP